MKNFIFALLFSFVAFSVSADEIEFDGAYVKKKNGDHVELVEQRSYSAVYWPNAPKRMSRSTLLNMDKVHYVIGSKAKTISKENFKGITLQGTEKEFEFLSLHPVKSATPTTGRDVFLAVEDEGRIKEGNKVYIAEEQIDFRTKIVSSNVLYAQPRETLNKGIYVAWSLDKFWLFELE